MDNQEKDELERQSSWDDLARELGADAPTEPIVPKATYKKVVEPEEPRKALEPAPRPKASPKSWDSLAADFGLEVPPPPPEPAAVERAKALPPAPEPVSPRDESEPRRPSRGGDRPPRRERSERRDESSGTEDRPPRRSRGGRSREERKRDDRPREERPRQQRERRPREEPVADEREEPRNIVSPEPAELDTPPATPPSLGVSLWHKIFGTPDQQAERIAESSSAAEIEDNIERESEPADWRRKSRGERSDESSGGMPDESDADETFEMPESWQAESVEFSLDDRADVESRPERPSEDEGEDRPRRRRRGRGRGRGRSHRPEGERSDDERAAESPLDRSEAPRDPRTAEGKRESRGRGRGGRSSRPRREDARRREEPRDNLDDDGLEEIVLDDDQDNLELVIDGEEAGPATARGRETVSGHKSIPSWDEAIGMIVEINLSTRTDRRRAAPSQSRGSGAPRGRSRGGRRRRKPS